MMMSSRLALRRRSWVLKRPDFAVRSILLRPLSSRHLALHGNAAFQLQRNDSISPSSNSVIGGSCCAIIHHLHDVVSGHCFVSPQQCSVKRASSSLSVVEYKDDPDPDPDDRPSAASSSSSSSSENAAALSVEEQYSRKTPLEHVLLRPGMYVGPNERLPPQECWVLDPPIPPPSADLLNLHPTLLSGYASSSSSTSPGLPTTTLPPSSLHMVKKEYGLVPALLKVFGEFFSKQ